MRSSIYRRIWVRANGPIPVDEHGRSYEIHHKDGNRENNELSNLECLSVDDHYARHLEQGDHAACLMIETRRNSDPSILREHASKHATGRICITNGTIDRRIKSDTAIPEGWWRGRSKGKWFGARSPEMGRKISEALTGKTLSPEHREKLSEAKLGKLRGPRSEDTKKRISAGNRGKTKSNAHKLSMSKSRQGKIHITNGVEGRLINADEEAPIGWYRGYKKNASNETQRKPRTPQSGKNQ